MKRSHSSTSMIETEREKKKKKKKGVVYALFEDDDGQYFIYKLGSVKGAMEDDYVMEIPQQPIETLKSFPVDMFFFSVGSKLYLCGGIGDGRNESLKAYMFDVTSNNKGIVSIDSMNSPKPWPLVFGPIDCYKFYLFSVSPDNQKPDLPSFEMFDTNTNRWESLPVPPYLSGLDFSYSALCFSSILLYTESIGLVVFCITTGVWRKLPLHHPDPRLPRRLPFDKAHSLFYEENTHYLLASEEGMPHVYSLKNDDLDFGPAASFHRLEWVDGFFEHTRVLDDFLGGWGMVINSFSLNDNSVFCFLRTGLTDSTRYKHFAIDILYVRYGFLEERTKVKVEVENTLEYIYRSKSAMVPRHFLVVA